MRLRTGAVTMLAGASLLAPEQARAQAPDPVTNVDHIRQRLSTPTPLRDAAVDAPPTFRVSVWQERVDITTFWGEPDAVGANVHPLGGPWHHEYQMMVVPEEFRGWGYTNIVDNATLARTAAGSMSLAMAMEHVPKAIKGGLQRRARRLAKEEVQRELAAFYAIHTEARPAAGASTPP